MILLWCYFCGLWIIKHDNKNKDVVTGDWSLSKCHPGLCSPFIHIILLAERKGLIRHRGCANKSWPSLSANARHGPQREDNLVTKFLSHTHTQARTHTRARALSIICILNSEKQYFQNEFILTINHRYRRDLSYLY